MLEHFAKLEAREDLPVKIQPKSWFVYATVCMLVIGLVISSVFFYKAQVAIATEKTRETIQKEYKNNKISSILVDLLRRRSTVDLIFKKIIVNLSSQQIEQEIYPHVVELSEIEKKLAKEILHQQSIPYMAFDYKGFYGGDFPENENFVVLPLLLCESNSDKMVNTKKDPYIIFSFKNGKNVIDISQDFLIKLGNKNTKSLLTFYTTDSIVRIEGYQYPNSLSKLAFVEVQSDVTKGYQVIFVIDLGKKKILGTDFKKKIE
jgi:hypothetical protein